MPTKKPKHSQNFSKSKAASSRTWGDACADCQKPQALCLCALGWNASKSPFPILILQHPQEPDKVLGTAPIVKKLISNATVRVGLSWPNLQKAFGPEPTGVPSGKNWWTLFLGQGLVLPRPAGSPATPPQGQKREKTLLPHELLKVASNTLPARPDGLIVLDGTWSQAKTLWWRNPWLTKTTRVTLSGEGAPLKPSLYRTLRKEPKREAVSTLEAIAETLDRTNATALASALRQGMQTYLELVQAETKKTSPTP